MNIEKYSYDISEKQKCWYKSICDGTKCGEKFCIRHYKMSCLTYMACMEGNLKYPIQLRLDSARTDQAAFYRLKEIQNNINTFVGSGKNLLIYSANTGNGKTEWSKKLLLSWFNSIWATTDFECRGLFVSLPKLMSAMKENITKPNEYYQYVNDNIVNADLVVWDEINYKDYSGYEHDYLLNIISERLALGKSNIYTTNYTLDVINVKLGSRLASRIVGQSEKVEFCSNDKRGLNI